MNVLQRVKGDLYLTWRALVSHPLRLAFSTDRRTGRQKFLDHYAGEGNLPLTDADRALLRAAGRCIHCGLCDAAVAADSPSVRPSLLPQVFTRATPELDHTPVLADALPPPLLERAEAACPTRVPLRELAAWVDGKARELKAAQRGGTT